MTNDVTPRGPNESLTVAELEILGALVHNMTTAARTDSGKDGEAHLYYDSTAGRAREQFYSEKAGAWTEIGGTVINNIQAGTVTLSNTGVSGTDTITSVDTAKAYVVYGGVEGTVTNLDDLAVRLTLTNATTVTADRTSGTAGDSVTVSYSVVEYAA